MRPLMNYNNLYLIAFEIAVSVRTCALLLLLCSFLCQHVPKGLLVERERERGGGGGGVRLFQVRTKSPAVSFGRNFVFYFVPTLALPRHAFIQLNGNNIVISTAVCVCVCVCVCV